MHFTNGSRAMVSTNLYIVSQQDKHTVEKKYIPNASTFWQAINSQKIKHKIVFLWHPCLLSMFIIKKSDNLLNKLGYYILIRALMWENPIIFTQLVVIRSQPTRIFNSWKKLAVVILAEWYHTSYIIVWFYFKF